MTSHTLLAALAQAATVPDTVVMVEHRSGFPLWVDVLTGAAQVVIALALIVLGAVLIPIALKTRKAVAGLQRSVEKLRVDVDPVLRHAVAAGDNVNYITTAVRGDVERLSATVVATNQRLERAMAAAERRAGDLSALLDVVQEEAESLFIGAASTARGVRAGAEAFRRLRGGGRVRDEEFDHGFEDDLDEDVDEDLDGGPAGGADRYASEAEERRAEDALRDEDLTDEELEIRVARRERRGRRSR